MDNTLREEQQAARAKVERKQRVSERSTPAQPLVCSNGITRAQLRDYLFRLRRDVLNDAARELERHIQAGCEACRGQIVEIEAGEAILRGEEEPRPPVNVKVIRKVPNEHLKREALVAELSRKLARELAGPAKSFTLEELSVMNAQIRTVSDTEKRKRIAERVVAACRARWDRLKSGAGLDAEVEDAAARLYTHIRTYHADPTKRFLRVEKLGLNEKKTCDLLLYLMTSMWFLYPEGANTWDLSAASRTVIPNAAEQQQGRAEPTGTVVFDLAVLKQALSTKPAAEDHSQKGPQT